ncbi:MAG: Rab family GTPase [Candidatus Kariarchaeaceae archaeon]|jgi:small GTP-binding protein
MSNANKVFLSGLYSSYVEILRKTLVDKLVSAWSFKIVIIGEPSVGKTSLRRSYLGEKFQANYLSTIGADFSFKQMETEDGTISSAIWDLAGQDEYYNVHPQYYRGAAGAMIVYDVTDQSTLDRISEWIERYISNSGFPDAPILIIGNKTDLLSMEEDQRSIEIQNKLISELKEKYPETISMIGSRTSAKTQENVEKSFTNLLHEIILWQKKGSLVEKTATDDIDRYIPAVYAITFHEMYGPRIIAKIPDQGTELSDSEISSAIKISSVIDFQDVAEHTQITASFPWISPMGNFTYIAFAVTNPEARGNKGLYIIGFVADRFIKDVILEKRTILDGFLHSSMNDFTNFLKTSETDFITSTIKSTDKGQSHEIQVILNRLRNNVFRLIKADL